jgi:2-polyprenyl-3-methyl-5-hydroxy-6-metoxy-1,4-benzoquinol methylase
LILRDIWAGISRFEEIQADLAISRKVLTERLNHLIERGVVDRRPLARRSCTGTTPAVRSAASTCDAHSAASRCTPTTLTLYRAQARRETAQHDLRGYRVAGGGTRRKGGRVGSAHHEDLGALLNEQAAYYQAVAAEYGDYRDVPGTDEVIAALDAFRPAGSVLELACGPGVWTRQLLRHAADVTAVDASREMLAVGATRVGSERVRFIQADLFSWEPDSRYDVVFFGFWLSHVPPERFEDFWSMVAGCLKPQGRVFFADDDYRTPEELVEGPSSPVIRRQLDDGTSYRLVKVPHQPANLQEQLGRLGWHITITPTSGRLYWGAGSRS